MVQSSPPYLNAIGWLTRLWSQTFGGGRDENDTEAMKESSSIPCVSVASMEPSSLAQAVGHEWRDDTGSISQMGQAALGLPSRRTSVEMDNDVQTQVDELQERIMEHSVDIAQLLNQIASISVPFV